MLDAPYDPNDKVGVGILDANEANKLNAIQRSQSQRSAGAKEDAGAFEMAKVSPSPGQGNELLGQ